MVSLKYRHTLIAHKSHTYTSEISISTSINNIYKHTTQVNSSTVHPYTQTGATTQSATSLHSELSPKATVVPSQLPDELINNSERTMAPPEKPIDAMKKATSSKRTDPLQKGLRKSTEEIENPESGTPDINSLSEQMALLLRSMGNVQDQFSSQHNVLNKLMSQNERFNEELTYMRNQQIESTKHMKFLEDRINQMQLEFDQKLNDRLASITVTAMEECVPLQRVTPTLQGSAVSKYATLPPSTRNTEDYSSENPIWIDKTKEKNTKNKKNMDQNTTEKNTNQDKPIDKKKLTKQQCLRYFSHVSSNQGYQYLHLPIKGKTKLKDMRSNLRQIGLSSGSVIDIQYPTSTVVSLLLHNDYVATASAILEEEGLVILKDFDPLDIKNLRDPRYSNLTEELKMAKLREIRASRIQQTLDFLRPPVKLAVARDFARKGWITEDKLHEIINTKESNSEMSKTAATNFITKPLSDDVHMDENETQPFTASDDEDIELTDSTSLVGDGEPTPSS